MENFFKQLGKSACYFLSFFGMQFIIVIVFEMFYIFKEVFAGEIYDVEAMTEGAVNYVLKNTNIVSVISGCLTLLLLWIFFRIRKKKLLEESNIKTMRIGYIPIIIMLGITFATAISFGLNLLPESMLEAYGENVQVVIGNSVAVMVISTMIMAPIVEEIIFRGLIFSRMKQAVPTVWAVIISSLIFGVAHGQIVWMTYAFVLGAMCAVIQIKTDSLLASILLHMVFNICGVVIPTLCSEFTSPIAIVIGTIVGLVATAILLVMLFRNKKSR